MPNILSIDVGTVSLGYVIYNPGLRKILAWGFKSVAENHSSFMHSLEVFEEECCILPFELVVIQRQLRHLNIQMGRLEANLEGYFRAKGKEVLLLPAGTKYESHGLQLPVYLLDKFQTWKALALQRAANGFLSKSQQTRLNKKKAMQMAEFFLQSNTQSTSINEDYDSAEKQDDLADALLQALAYSCVVLGLGPMPQHAAVIVIE